MENVFVKGYTTKSGKKLSAEDVIDVLQATRITNGKSICDTYNASGDLVIPENMNDAFYRTIMEKLESWTGDDEQRVISELLKDESFRNMETEVTVFIPQIGKFMYVSEGGGGNLDHKDMEDGLVDYVYIEVYGYVGQGELMEIDGGQIDISIPFREKYHSEEEYIKDALEDQFGNRDLGYIIVPTTKITQIA